MNKITQPPWTPAQVRALNRFQASDYVHPFTCSNEHEGNSSLIATRLGWVCRRCDYKQGWAHAMMLEPPPKKWGKL